MIVETTQTCPLDDTLLGPTTPRRHSAEPLPVGRVQRARMTQPVVTCVRSVRAE